VSPRAAFSSPLGFDLLRPDWLALTLLGALLALAGWYGLRLRRRERARLVADRLAPRFLPGFSEGRARLRLLLAAGAAALMGLAVAGPVRGWTVREVERRGIDLVVCVDTSRSMLARDLRPSRLARARREVAGLLDRLRGDRVALIAFAGLPREVAPLTHDRTTLAALLDTLSPEENEQGGTDLGAALERALALFDGRTGAHEAIVVLTDGEDHEGRGLEAARAAAERGIRVFVVGMGTPEGGKIPVQLPDGGEGFLSDREGREVVSALDGTTLAALARATGGEYLAATQAVTPLEELYDKRISTLEGRELGGGEEWVPHDRYQWALVLAAACMLGEAGLRERRRARRRLAWSARGRLEEAA
jgi:Ca-activated chloride channel family protein